MIVAVSCDRRSLGPKPVSHRVGPPRAEVFVKDVFLNSFEQQGCRQFYCHQKVHRSSWIGSCSIAMVLS